MTTATLRDYQVKTDGEIRNCLRSGAKRILVVAPTGAGKTVMFSAGIVEPAAAKGSSVWIVVPRKQLVQQTMKKLDELGIPFGVIWANHPRTNYREPIQVCSIQTLAPRLKSIAFKRPDIVIYDEAHHCTKANQYGQIMAFCEGSIQIGFTATPCRADGAGLGDVFERIVVSTSVRKLIAEGWLKDCKVYRGASGDLSSVRITRGDYNEADLVDAQDKITITGDAIREYKEHAEGRPAVVFAITCRHAQHVCEQANAAGIPCGYIDADTPDDVRTALIAQLVSGELLWLVSVGVFTEGFDCPAVSCVIFLRPTKSLSLFLQMAGRGLRPVNKRAEPGEHCVFLDHANLFGYEEGQHGHVTDERKWKLETTKKKLKKSEKKEAAPKDCDGCGMPIPRNAIECPFCHVEQPAASCIFESTEDRLELWAEGEMAEEQAALLARRQAHYAELEEAGFIRGWKPLAVSIRFKEKWGEFPTKADRSTSKDRLVWFRNADGKFEWRWRHDLEAVPQLA